MILLDTNICIYIINGNRQIQKRLKQHVPNEVYISSISVAELFLGASKSRMQEATRDKVYSFIERINILDFSFADAVKYGEIRAYLEKRGEVIGPLDMLIAAQAVAGNYKLITNNVREFQRVPDLILEDWIYTP